MSAVAIDGVKWDRLCVGGPRADTFWSPPLYSHSRFDERRDVLDEHGEYAGAYIYHSLQWHWHPVR